MNEIKSIFRNHMCERKILLSFLVCEHSECAHKSCLLIAAGRSYMAESSKGGFAGVYRTTMFFLGCRGLVTFLVSNTTCAWLTTSS